jgi:hypothetical protein
MRDPSALPDADMVAVSWTDSPRDGSPSRPDKAKSLSGAMLALGAALILFVPISGVFFLVAGGLGLTMSSAGTPPTDNAPAVVVAGSALGSEDSLGVVG